MKAIVVGAGLSGITAAWRLKKAGWAVQVIESGDRIGGRVQTVAKQGYLIDTGASAMTSSYHAYLALADDAGLRGEVVLANQCVGFVRDNRVHEFNTRHIMRSGLFTGLLSLRSKFGLARLFIDVFRARAQGLLDYNDLSKAAALDTESAADYAVREFNREINDYFCDPVVRVMLLANGDKVSKVEFFSGVANVFDAELCSMRGGQQRFVEALANGLDVTLNSTVSRVRDVDNHVEVTWRNAHGAPSEQTERADVCVVACPLPLATAICADYRALLQPLNESLSYTRAISVAIGTTALPATKAMVVDIPSCEDRNIAALFLEHNKCADRAPAGHALFTAYLEAAATESLWQTDDEAIVQQTLAYILRLFPNLSGKVDMTHVTRWPCALPLTKIGSYQAIGRLNAQLDHKARIQFAGDYLSCAGQNTAVEFGTRAARNIIDNHH